ncbi:hypothetical protein MHU86_24110 [Fragilaria crotonensis]|nr:hypothetical protein MHU86_24110 [Fragilaria crotonensis]
MNATRLIASKGLLLQQYGRQVTRQVYPVRGWDPRQHTTKQSVRFYTFPSPTPPMTTEEEQAEKSRVATLSANQKNEELKIIDQKLALLHMQRGINTGELYTFRGKMKALTRDYGLAFMAWYWTVWTTTAGMVWVGIEVGGFDAIELLVRVDGYMGWTMSQHVDPTIGTIGLVLAVNELLEPLRLPLVVMTTKPVVNLLSSASFHK